MMKFSYLLCSMTMRKQIPFYRQKPWLSSFCSLLPSCSCVSSDAACVYLQSAHSSRQKLWVSPFCSVQPGCSSVSSGPRVYRTELQQSNRHQVAHFSSLKDPLPGTSLRSYCSDENGKTGRLEVEIISVEHIKPASPTPDHSKLYKLSLLDQMLPNMYVSFVYFYESNDDHQQAGNGLADDHELIISNRRQVLKKSLSETLTKFYPLAGKVSADDQFIDCNDEGVYYVEARVEDHLSDFLAKPRYKLIHRLLPFDPSSNELLSMTYVTMIQATVFGCGGCAVGIYCSHKIIDGVSYATFMKAWAATARGCSHLVSPSFVSSSIFPPMAVQQRKLPMGQREGGKTVTRRFVFSASSLMMLKRKSSASSRVIAVTSLIWKCAMTAKSRSSATTVHNCKTKSYTVYLPVNIRARSSPPLPPYSIGNIFWTTFTQYKVLHDDDSKTVELGSLVILVRNALYKINSNFIEILKGEEGNQRVKEYMKGVKEVWADGYADLMAVSSMCNSGMYEVDFGWGKPVWVSFSDADSDNIPVEKMVYLMDTASGGGIEAWVTLPRMDMAILESDSELLALASLDPSPLLVDDA